MLYDYLKLFRVRNCLNCSHINFILIKISIYYVVVLRLTCILALIISGTNSAFAITQWENQ